MQPEWSAGHVPLNTNTTTNRYIFGFMLAPCWAAPFWVHSIAILALMVQGGGPGPNRQSGGALSAPSVEQRFDPPPCAGQLPAPQDPHGRQALLLALWGLRLDRGVQTKNSEETSLKRGRG